MDGIRRRTLALATALAVLAPVGCASPRASGAAAGESDAAPSTRSAEVRPALLDAPAAGDAQPTAGTPRVVVVELFSSEGCSSCPPADGLLAELSAAPRSDGLVVVGLEHHVDYWDRLGWKDPFSSAASTERQSRYGEVRGGDSIFTPEVVVDGVSSLVGSRRGALEEAIRARAAGPWLPVRARLGGGGRTVHVELDRAPPRPADLVVASTESGLSTAVPAGENAGETLRHGPIVRSMQRAGEARAGAFDVTLDASIAGPRQEVVVFVQARPQGEILGAARVAR